MTDSATTVSPAELRRQGPRKTLERIEAYAEDHPEAEEYLLEGEQEAAEVLIAMAGTMKVIQADLAPGVDRDTVYEICKTYRQAVAKGKATELFRAMSEDDQLEIYGLRLRMRQILLQ
jgi:hypothetical protein